MTYNQFIRYIFEKFSKNSRSILQNLEKKKKKTSYLRKPIIATLCIHIHHHRHEILCNASSNTTHSIKLYISHGHKRAMYHLRRVGFIFSLPASQVFHIHMYILPSPTHFKGTHSFYITLMHNILIYI